MSNDSVENILPQESGSRPWFARRGAWLLLVASAVVLELTALGFQYGMGLDPCVMCIYERVAVFGLLLAGTIGVLHPGSAALRWAGYLTWAISAGWGLQLALRHVGIQIDKTASLGCSFAAEFPAWARLDEWFPAVFLPTGYCDDIQWQWMSLTMAQWMVVVFAVYLLILAEVLLTELRTPH